MRNMANCNDWPLTDNFNANQGTNEQLLDVMLSRQPRYAVPITLRKDYQQPQSVEHMLVLILFPMAICHGINLQQAAIVPLQSGSTQGPLRPKFRQF